MTWSLAAAATLPLALAMWLIRRRGARRRHARDIRRGKMLGFELGRLRGGVFDARRWPREGAAPGDYRRPAGIRGNDPAILPPPGEIPDEDLE